MKELKDMTVAELKEFAQANEIELTGCKNKKTILAKIEEVQGSKEKEGGTTMEVDMEQEMETREEMDTQTPDETDESEVNADANADADADVDTDKKVASDKKVWYNAAGEEVSMSAFVREKFLNENMSRKDISDTYDINYRTVYGATINLENDAEPATRGRGALNPKINVTADNKILTSKITIEGDEEVEHYFLDGEEIQPDENGELLIPETTETLRNDFIIAQVKNGIGRGDLAKQLGISYGVVYGVTKDLGSSRQKHEMTYVDEEGKETVISRSEYIRKRVESGLSKAEVAKEMGVEYSVVWQATKKDKTDQERLDDLFSGLEKFIDKVEDKYEFEASLLALKTLAVIKEEEETTDADGEDEDETDATADPNANIGTEEDADADADGSETVAE